MYYWCSLSNGGGMRALKVCVDGSDRPGQAAAASPSSSLLPAAARTPLRRHAFVAATPTAMVAARARPVRAHPGRRYCGAGARPGERGGREAGRVGRGRVCLDGRARRDLCPSAPLPAGGLWGRPGVLLARLFLAPPTRSWVWHGGHHPSSRGARSVVPGAAASPRPGAMMKRKRETETERERERERGREIESKRP